MEVSRVSRQKEKGTAFETQVVRYLRVMLPWMDIDRAPLKGAKDEGDVKGLTIRGLKCVVECKNHRRMELSEWMDEAEEEMSNADAEFAFVAIKRKGYGDTKIGGTYVLTTLENLAAIAAGSRELCGED
jgi:hypothetical protein